jgi:hypothetical protein
MQLSRSSFLARSTYVGERFGERERERGGGKRGKEREREREREREVRQNEALDFERVRVRRKGE